MGRYGQGSVGLDKRGKWRARLYIDGARRQIGTFEDRRQAEMALAAVQASLPAPSHGGLTVGAWGLRWLDQRETDGVHRSSATDRSVWRARVASSALAELPVDLVSAGDVREWLRLQLRTPSSSTGKLPNRQTVQNALNILRVCLEAAVQQGHAQGNPARDVRLPRGSGARTDEPWDWLRADELGALWGLSSLVDPHRSMLEVAVHTGLRAGELWGLRWADVDLRAGELHVRRSYHGPTKSGKTRHVPLLDQAWEALERWRGGRSGSRLVWPAEDGAPRRKGYDASLRRHLEAAGVRRRVRFHDLRHTCASHLVQGTWGRVWTLAEVGQLLGHASQMTTQRYAHLCPSGLRRAVAETRRGVDRMGSDGERSRMTGEAK